VDGSAQAVWLHIDWRRRDQDADRRQIIVKDAATGEDVANLVRISISRQSGDLAFGPVAAPGEYHVYYLPYAPQDSWGWYGGDYLPVKAQADPGWLKANGLEDLATGRWRELPKARVLEIQAAPSSAASTLWRSSATPEEVKGTPGRPRRRALPRLPGGPPIPDPHGR